MANFVAVPACYPKLVDLRKSKTASFKNNKFLKETTKLRYYQTIGALHMMMLERMVLGDSTGTGKCVSEDTYIPTSLGMIKIKDLCKELNLIEDSFYNLSEDLKILSIEGEKSAPFIYYSGIKTGLKITTSKGFELIGLKHHPIFAPDDISLNYKRLDSFKIGDFVCINRKGIFTDKYFKTTQVIKGGTNTIDYKIPEFIDESLAELLGYYVSEGHSSVKTSFIITQFAPDVHNRIRSLLKDIFGYIQNDQVKNYKEELTKK